MKRYDKYKDSGVEWLREIPEHWDLQRTKNLFALMKRDPLPDDGIVTAFRDGEVTLRSNRRTEGFTNAVQEHGYQRVLAGDLVIHAMDAFAGAIGVSDSDGKSTPVYSVCHPKYGNVVSRYYGRLMRHMALAGYINSLAKGVRERSSEFRWSEACEVILAVPPAEEQHQINAFLDQETAKIDALVAEQRRLIELLKEKRQVVISHAVTKGLNPNVKLKPSGVRWLGDVPEHWDVVPIKHLVSRAVIDGPHESPTKLDDGIPFVSAEAVSQGSVDFEKKWGFISTADHERYSQRYKPRRGDILIVKLGATCGASAIVETDEDFNIWVPLAAVRLDSEIDPRFVLHVLRSNNLRQAYELSWTFGTQQTLGLRTIENLRIPLPPTLERSEIVAFLETHVPRFDSLTAEAERAINLLQERRAALISAAVTGKIDVRNIQTEHEHRSARFIEDDPETNITITPPLSA